MGMPVTLIGEAVFARCLSALKDARVEASKVLAGPKTPVAKDRAEFIERGVRWRQRTPEEIEARVQAILAIAAESAALLKDAPPFTEDDLYDENGLPA